MNTDTLSRPEPTVLLHVGGRYPLPLRVRKSASGAAANFLGATNVLQVAMPSLIRSEILAVRKGPMKVGLIKDGPLLLLLFEFDGGIIMDCPFDVRILPADILNLPDVENELQRLYVEVHLVDSETMVLRGLRGVTLPPALTQEFLIAARHQLADDRDVGTYLAKYYQLPITTLRAMTGMQLCGK
jgi:hypothetical protein